MNSSFSAETIREFLLDRLSLEQAEPLEEQMVRDEAFFAEVQDAEDDLIDEYVLESLEPADAERFRERINRNPDLQDRVALRRALIGHLQRSAAAPAAAPVQFTPARGRRWDRFLIPGFALALLALFVVSFVALRKEGSRSQIAQTTAAPAPDGVPASSAAAVLFLPDHVARGAAQQPSVLHSGGAGVVKLELETAAADPSQRWQVSVSAGQQTVYSAQNLVPRQAGVVSYVVAEVPAAQLPPALYTVTLSPQSGAIPPSSWDLQVVK